MLLFLFTLSLIAQFNETIPTTHWIYHSIEKLQIGGYLRDLEQGCQPYTRMQIARAIIQNEKSDIQNVRLKNDAKKIIYNNQAMILRRQHLLN